MTRRSKIAAGIAIAVAGLTLLAILAAILITRSGWFANSVREKIIVAVENSTGGKVGLRSFSFEWRTLTATAHDFVIHGTEPPGSAPLFEAPVIVLKMKLALFTGVAHLVDLESLRVASPEANVIVFRNGETNFPKPKLARASNTQQDLDRIVNLAIGHLDISNGTVRLADRSVAFSAHGDRFLMQWTYDPRAAEYQGAISMDPLRLSSDAHPPLATEFLLPVTISKSGIRVADATLRTAQSSVTWSAAIRNLAAPDVDAQMTGHLTLSEFVRSFDLPIHPAPDEAANLFVSVHSNPRAIEIRNASLALGASHLEMEGNLRTGADFHAAISIAEVGSLLHIAERPEGSVEIAGRATLNGSRYAATGNVDASDLSLRGAGSRLQKIALTTSFQIDPGLVAFQNLNLSAWGGTLTGGAEIHGLKTIDASVAVHGFSIGGLSETLAHRAVNYGGAISGTLSARGDLKSPDLSATLIITPRSPGVPVSGRLDASYGAGVLALDDSRLRLPHTSIELTDRTKIRVVSRDLADFQPAIALVSAHPPPVSLTNGEARFDFRLEGPLLHPSSLSGNFDVMHLLVSGREFDRLAANFSASSSNASLAGGTISRNSFLARFSASAGLRDWRLEPRDPIAANVTVRNGDLADVFALAGANPAGVRGLLTADVRVSGTFGDPLGSAQASVVNGAIRNQPFDRIALAANASDRRIDLNALAAAAGSARIDAQGTFTHPRDSISTGHIEFHAATNRVSLSEFQAIDEGWSGEVEFHADLAADLSAVRGSTKWIPRRVNANLSATGIRDRGENYGNLTASAITESSTVRTQVDSNFAGSSIRWTGATALTDDYPTTGQADIRALPLEKALAVAQEPLPVRGLLSANARLAGTLHEPRAGVSFELTRADLYDQPIRSAAGSLDYSNELIRIASLRVSSTAGQLDLRGSFTHPPSSFASGQIDLHAAIPSLALQRVHWIEQSRPGLTGDLQLNGDFSGELETHNGHRTFLPSSVAAKASLSGVSVDQHPLGGLDLTAQTAGRALSVDVHSNLGGADIRGDASIALAGNYAAQGKLTFASVTYRGLGGLVSAASLPEGFDATAAGSADFSGPLLDPAAISGDLTISKLEISATVAGARRIALENPAPMKLSLNSSTLRIENVRLNGPSTQILVNGSVGFAKSAPVNLTVEGNADLLLVKQIYPGAFANGVVTLASTIRGSLAQPVLNGRVQFKDASLQLSNWPNGIYNANGVILLNGRTASVQSFTAQSGGGKISLAGFVGFAGSTLTYDAQAEARGIRVRYSGASLLANSRVSLTGSSLHSVLSGTVTIERIAYSQQTDLGSILSGSGAIPPAQASAAGFLSRTRLSIRVQTAPGLQFQASAAQQLTATADLTLVGTLASPGLEGRVSITEGNLLFFGNKYTVNRGTISFYDPLAIRPVLDIDLQTLVQGVTVEIGVSGPIDNLKLTYHSDPPLRFEDIIALLATGRTPPDPTIAAQQPPQPDQTATQMGESALLGQAIANPVASRLQRVFGVSQLKIAPEFVTGSAIPQARITLQQQVSQSVTFTYSQDLSQTNSQLVRIEWDFTSRFSAVATRDENGIFGVDFFWRHQFH